MPPCFSPNPALNLLCLLNWVPGDVCEEGHPDVLCLLAHASRLLPVGPHRVHEDRPHHAEVVVRDAAQPVELAQLQQVFRALQRARKVSPFSNFRGTPRLK